MSEISDRLSALIAGRGLSYSELERLTGIPKSALQRYATGATSNIPIDRIKGMAKALGCTPEYMMGWDDHPTPTNKTAPAQSEGISGAYLNMAKHAQDSGVDPDDIQQMIDIMKKNEAKKNDKG